MDTVLITLETPLLTVDLDVPAELPLAELVPVLLDVCGMVERGAPPARGIATWALGTPQQAAPFPSTSTLAQCGVHNGAYLALRDAHTWGRPAPAPAEPPAERAEQSTTVVEAPVEHHPGGIGVRWRRDALQ